MLQLTSITFHLNKLTPRFFFLVKVCVTNLLTYVWRDTTTLKSYHVTNIY